VVIREATNDMPAVTRQVPRFRISVQASDPRSSEIVQIVCDRIVWGGGYGSTIGEMVSSLLPDYDGQTDLLKTNYLEPVTAPVPGKGMQPVAARVVDSDGKPHQVLVAGFAAGEKIISDADKQKTAGIPANTASLFIRQPKSEALARHVLAASKDSVGPGLGKITVEPRYALMPPQLEGQTSPAEIAIPERTKVELLTLPVVLGGYSDFTAKASALIALKDIVFPEECGAQVTIAIRQEEGVLKVEASGVGDNSLLAERLTKDGELVKLLAKISETPGSVLRFSAELDPVAFDNGVRGGILSPQYFTCSVDQGRRTMPSPYTIADSLSRPAIEQIASDTEDVFQFDA
jgi:hypothetical protein